MPASIRALHQHRRVGDQRVAADMVEMKMGIDDEVDLRRIAVHGLESGTDLFAGLKADPKEPGNKSRTGESFGVGHGPSPSPGLRRKGPYLPSQWEWRKRSCSDRR